MKCPNCGATVLKGDRSCRKCGTILGTTKMKYAPEDQVRPRLALVFRAWVGAEFGLHLKWLGYDGEAQRVRMQYGVSFAKMIMIYPMIMTIFYQVIECTAVMFGKYRTDAYGHPVRYLNLKRHRRK